MGFNWTAYEFIQFNRQDIAYPNFKVHQMIVFSYVSHKYIGHCYKVKSKYLVKCLRYPDNIAYYVAMDIFTDIINQILILHN